jgi:uncharacterized phage infection (PIP) family protein YhgE
MRPRVKKVVEQSNLDDYPLANEKASLDQLKEINPELDEVNITIQKLDRRHQTVEEDVLELIQKLDDFDKAINKQFRGFNKHKIYGDLTHSPLFRHVTQLHEGCVGFLEALKSLITDDIRKIVDGHGDLLDALKPQLESIVADRRELLKAIENLKYEKELVIIERDGEDNI